MKILRMVNVVCSFDKREMGSCACKIKSALTAGVGKSQEAISPRWNAGTPTYTPFACCCVRPEFHFLIYAHRFFT